MEQRTMSLDEKVMVTRLGKPSIVVTIRDLQRGNAYLTELFEEAERQLREKVRQTRIERLRAGGI